MTKKDFLRLFLQLVDTTNDYKESKSIMSDKNYLASLLQNGILTEDYLFCAIDELIAKANISPADAEKIKNDLRSEKTFTIKRLIFLVHKYQK